MKCLISVSVLFGVLAALLLAQPVPAEAAMFVKISGIAGESKDKDHDRWIDIVAVSPAVTKTTSTKSGVVTHQEITITKFWDMASPLLQTALATGQKLDEVVLHFTDSGGNVIKIQTLKNVSIIGIMPGFDAKAGSKTEMVTLAAEAIK